ncbi:MAG: 50S ribosomal protein L5 [Candidatus Diapherotrites archaeon]|nr:50S ribosomal protein L5 [Candidatus Diapherotrites archaeon]
MNSMKQIRVEKVTLNIGAGEPGEKLEKAKLLIEKLTEKKPIETLSKVRQPKWGLRAGLPIGAKVTLRGEDAIEFLKKAFYAVEERVSEKSFDNQGNFSFGIQEYLYFPEMKYDPQIGIMGLEVAVTLERPGYSIKRKRLASKIGKSHLIKKQDAIDFISKEFKIKVFEKDDESEVSE